LIHLDFVCVVPSKESYFFSLQKTSFPNMVC
jgi:hypothetical protein